MSVLADRGSMKMEYAVLFAVFVIFLMIKSAAEKRRRERELEQRIRESFGTLSQEEYSEEKYRSIQYYFRSGHRAKEQRADGAEEVLDDITWNDLDMDRLYQAINRTSCAMGEEYLYDLLRRPLYEKDALTERQRVISFFEEHEEERVRLSMALAQIGKFPQISLYEYYHRAMDLADTSAWFDILQALLLLAAIPFTVLIPAVGGPCMVVLVAANVVTYFQRKKRIDPYLQVIAFLVRLTQQAEGLRTLSLPGLEAYQERINTGAAAFSGVRRGAWLINSGSSMSGDLADIVMDYIRILFHVDLIKVSSMVTAIRRHEAELDLVYETIGLLDSCMAVASFRAYLPEWCVPELREVPDSSVFLQAENLYHPLLEQPVKNSIDTTRSVLITGSNASGKSTFLKTVAVNAVLAQTMATAACGTYQGGYFRIYSSMALTDNLFGKESYYMVEIKSLKRILDAATKDLSLPPVLCCIDEVLRGTNTLERIAASSQILSVLAKLPVLAFVATHDLELTQILDRQYENYHFSEEVAKNDIFFDYRLKAGRAESRNAIRLLSLLGFPEELTEAAQKQAEHFLAAQEWRCIG